MASAIDTIGGKKTGHFLGNRETGYIAKYLKINLAGSAVKRVPEEFARIANSRIDIVRLYLLE